MFLLSKWHRQSNGEQVLAITQQAGIGLLEIKINFVEVNKMAVCGVKSRHPVSVGTGKAVPISVVSGYPMSFSLSVVEQSRVLHAVIE